MWAAEDEVEESKAAAGAAQNYLVKVTSGPPKDRGVVSILTPTPLIEKEGNLLAYVIKSPPDTVLPAIQAWAEAALHVGWS